MLRIATYIVFASLIVPRSLVSQERDWDVQYVDATRESLEAVRGRYAAAAASQAYSPELRARARSEASAARARLAQGDFRIGDRVLLTVERMVALSDSFVVSKDRAIELPIIGEMSLDGVLRSELESALTERIAEFVNDPVVRARSYIRISVTGETGQQGFYSLPPETPLPEAVMLAGGPTQTAILSRLEVKRGSELILGGESLQLAVREGRTLGELGMRSGDEIVLKRRSILAPGELARTLIVVSGVVFAIDRIFRR